MERFHRLAHSVWDCKSHMVWIPKYRRKKLYGTRRQIVIDTIKQWSRIKGIEIIEGHAMSDHIHSRSPFKKLSIECHPEPDNQQF